MHKERGSVRSLGYLLAIQTPKCVLSLRSQENYGGTFSLMGAKLIKRNEKNKYVLWIFPVAVQWRLVSLGADYNLMC